MVRIFATSRVTSVPVEVAPEGERARHPAVRYDAVAERLAAGQSVSVACEQVGRELARDGADLGEALDGLRVVYARVQGGEPGFRALRSLCLGWSEETLSQLHQVSCENPLTGLASRAHLRARLAEVYRGAEQGGSGATEHVFVVLDLPLLDGGVAARSLGAVLREVELADRVRLAFPGQETISEIGPGRLVVLTERSELLARQVRTARDLVESLPRGAGRARVWVEGLPDSDRHAGWLLDELARDTRH